MERMGINGLENSILATILFEEKKFDEVAQYLKAEDFFTPFNALVFKTMAKCIEKNVPFNADKIHKLVSGAREYDETDFLAIISATPMADIGYYAKFLKDESKKRLLRHICANTLENINKGEEESGEIIEQLEQGLFQITLETSKIEEFSSQVDKALELFLEAKKDGGKLRGLDTGFSKLNSITTGLNAGELIVIGARPSMGKTALVLNIVQSILNKGDGVAFFSLEMPAIQLINRLVASYASIDLQKIRVGTMTDNEEEEMLKAIKYLKTLSLVIDDSSYVSIFELKTKVRFLKRKRPELKCVVVDYLQLMSASKSSSDKMRHEEIAEISRGLKNLARELDIVVVALSQLNRGVEGREDKRPNLGDLRESGSIEQDADVIIFLYRDDVYAQRELIAKQKKMEKEGRLDPTFNKEEKPIETAELIVAKNRNGATKTVFVQFNKKYTRFEEPTKEQTKQEEGMLPFDFSGMV